MFLKNKKVYMSNFENHSLLNNSYLNKDCAFTTQERNKFNLQGLLPESVDNISIQSKRLWINLNNIKSNLEKYFFLRNIQRYNKILFYKLLEDNLEKILPIIYTPTVGLACKNFYKTSNYHGSLFISYPNKEIIYKIIKNINQKIKIIILTDGERVLGLGDQGIGGANIIISKSILYTICAGINPYYILPIMIDVGTNNEILLNSPFYLGWKHKRIEGIQYKKFIENIIKIIKMKWPKVLIHFEDFAKNNATSLLKYYKNKICTFNDDIQGTATVTLGTILSAINKELLQKQIIVIFGAGSAGCGIANHIIDYIKIKENINGKKAKKNIFMVDTCGLLTNKTSSLNDFQLQLAQDSNIHLNWNLKNNFVSLLDVVKNTKPNILIGVSGQFNFFTKEIISEMKKNCINPIIMPLSNPATHIEAIPENILDWTNGKALIATGSPFKNIKWKKNFYSISQCNNIYVFPGIGLGVIISNAQKITKHMLITASQTLANICLLESTSDSYKSSSFSLLPHIRNIRLISKKIALEVAKAATIDGVGKIHSEKETIKKIENNFWIPRY